ncbi:MAG: AMP-binding protein [Acetivibrio sp.]
MNNSIISYFDKTVQKFPKRIAIMENTDTITFEELRKKSLRYAEIIGKKNDFRTKDPIAVFLPKSSETVISNLAIMYTGNVFMNLDILTPIERIIGIIQKIKPKLLITNLELMKKYESNLRETKILCIEEMREDFSVFDEKKILNSMTQFIDTDPFCIINTSGSTGIPKGVVLNHKSFVDFLNWAVETFDFAQDTIMGSLSPCVFDIYVFELCMMSYQGLCMDLLDANLAIFPIKLINQLVKDRVNFLFWVPSIMVNIANLNILEACLPEELRTIWFAGEVFPTKQFNYWKKHLPKTTFANLYGPIEITLDCTYFIVNREFTDKEALPIGYPCNNTDILILNEKDEICQEKEVGELCVRGTSLAMGYYNDLEKTKSVFTQNPLNSVYPELIYRTGDMVYKNENREIMICGRKDNIIKHMGYRIELGEIEHVLINQLKIVEYCCAVYDHINKKIVLYYESSEKVNTIIFRKMLAQKLPKYMIPTEYRAMELLPRNINGKIDRQLLKEMCNEEKQ